MEKDQKELLEQEVEQVKTQDDVEKIISEEVVKTKGKFGYYCKTILSGAIDQILSVALALILFLVFDLILRVVGYEIAMREEMFLIIFIITNILYYPISQEILKGKTVGKRIISR